MNQMCNAFFPFIKAYRAYVNSCRYKAFQLDKMELRPILMLKVSFLILDWRKCMDTDRAIAYFSMEIGLEAAIPTYSGGLGVLAGDTIRSAADCSVPMVAVSLLHRKGYFYQRLDSDGVQSEEAVEWRIDDFLQPVQQKVQLTLDGRNLMIGAWVYHVKGNAGYEVPVILLDADLDENDPNDRALTQQLYGGDKKHRLCQEAILGIGGVRMLRALDFKKLRRFHMNEGHASLLTLELLDEHVSESGAGEVSEEAIDAVRKQCIFTTHTPVPAGHDQFPLEMVKQVLGEHEALNLEGVFCCEGTLNMTYLALSLSHYVNGVAKKHGEVSQQMFVHYQVDWITNGVHAETWTSEPFRAMYDEHIPGWRKDNFSLRYALSIPPEKIWSAHLEAKKVLTHCINRIGNTGMDMETLTIGFARRSTAYKRPDLIFRDIERLEQIAQERPLQFVFSGKAHPNDQQGKEIIKKIFLSSKKLRDHVKIVYLPNYDIDLGKIMTSGVDLWLNTPQPPMEASGTSGMKAALNGVPSLSILDGWWLEGCIEGVTGWAIGPAHHQTEGEDTSDQDATSLYDKLQNVIAPLFYDDRKAFITIMAHAIALNGSFFNTQRMIQQYVLKGYLT